MAKGKKVWTRFQRVPTEMGPLVRICSYFRHFWLWLLGRPGLIIA
jgi:hypothetical protein